MAVNPPKRGRPQTLSRDHVVHIASMRYWNDGLTRVSINDICMDAGVSKPGVYREFGNDDGLKRAALMRYKALAIEPLFDILAQDIPLSKSIDAIIEFTTQDREALKLPDGCLFADMRAHARELGTTARKAVDDLRKETLDHYENWIERAKSRGELSNSTPTHIAALYCDAQNGAAMRMQREGVDIAYIEANLRLAYNALA